MGTGDCGSAYDQSWWFKNLGRRGLFGTPGNFKLSTNQSIDQTTKPQANRLAILSAGQTFNPPTNFMPSLIARASPPPSVGRRKQRYYYSCSPSLTPTRPKDISPRSRPTESGSARASSSFAFRYGGQARLRFRSGGFPINPLPFFGEVGRQEKGCGELGDWQAVAL